MKSKIHVNVLKKTKVSGRNFVLPELYLIIFFFNLNKMNNLHLSKLILFTLYASIHCLSIKCKNCRGYFLMLFTLYAFIHCLSIKCKNCRGYFFIDKLKNQASEKERIHLSKSVKGSYFITSYFMS